MSADKAQVLIIDGDPGMRSTLSDILKDAGYRVKDYGKGGEALDWLRKNPFDVVIVDIKLPDMGGMKLLEQIRLINPESAVIMMTGYASVETAVEAMREGAYAYVTKPFNVDEVKAIIKKAIRSIRLSLENKGLIDDLQWSNIELARANQRLEGLDRMKSEFLANMSHELRTPLNSVIGFSELILDGLAGDINQKQKRFLNNIRTSGKTLLQLIDDILDLSKIEAGKMEFHPEELDLNSVIQSAKEIVLPLAKEKKMRFEIEVGEVLPKVIADRKKVEQILFNLVGNAIKFTPEGGTIKISVIEEKEESQISVSDTGIGIKEEDLETIFESFRQLDSSVTKKYKGAGLGLAITKRLVQMHNGRIWVESKLGEGTKFTFTLPKRRSNEAITYGRK